MCSLKYEVPEGPRNFLLENSSRKAVKSLFEWEGNGAVFEKNMSLILPLNLKYWDTHKDKGAW